jgi:hypothetical protein
VLREASDRVVVYCNRCPARLDLGRIPAVRARNRTPSGWIRTARDTHYCPLCSPNITAAALYATAGGSRSQPLL